jgi:hypothetical protein
MEHFETDFLRGFAEKNHIKDYGANLYSRKQLTQSLRTVQSNTNPQMTEM